MRLDRRHLIASAVLLAGSILYNVWVFWGPASAESRNPSAARATPGGQPLPEVSGGSGSIDPRLIPPPPAVDLTVTPEWNRDPFRPAGEVAAPPAVADAQPAAVDAPPADPVVGAILFSPERRLAIVNGKTYGIGDRLSAGVIVDITRNAIVVRNAAGQLRELSLLRPHSRELPR